MGCTESLMSAALDFAKKQLLKQRNDKAGPLSTKDVEAICIDPQITDPFRGIETAYLQDKFFRDNFNLIVSSSKLLLLLFYKFNILELS